MTLSIRYLVLLAAVSAILGAGIYKHFAPVQTKTVETTKEVVRTDVQTVIKTVRLPNGQEETTTTVVDHTITKDTASKTAVVVKAPTINVSALVANDFSTGSLKPLYGISVSKELLGPITVGAFGLTNGTIGLSLGINF